MNLAQQAWEAGDIRRVRELLERHRPHPGESDLRHFEWHYLNRLCHQELLTLDARSGPASQVAFSPDGKRLASAHRSAVTVWDAQTGRELLLLKGAGRFVAFSPDGKRLATGGLSDQERVVEIWDAQTGQELTTLHTGFVDGVAFSPDGKRLACGSATFDSTKRVYGAGELKVWDVETGRELLVLKGHNGLTGVAYSPDGKRLASVGQKPDGKPLAGAGRKSGPAPAVAEVKVWDAETGQEVLTVEAPAMSYDYGTVAYSPDGKRLIHVCVSRYRAESSSTMTVWDAQTGRELLTQKTDGQVTTVAFSPDGKRLVTGAGRPMVSGSLINRAIRVWDAETGQELYSLKGHALQVNSVAFSPDGSRLASASADGTVKVWDATTIPEARAIPDGILSPDGKHLALAVGNEVKVWDTQTGRETPTLTGHTGRVQSVAFDPDGRRLVSAAADRTVKVWDTQTGRQTLTLTGHTGPVQSVKFSPDGRRLVGAATDRTVKVWDAQTGHELRTFKGFAGPDDDSDSVAGGMGPVAVSPDGRRVASGHSVGVGTGPKTAWTTEVKVWDAQSGREVVTYKGNVGPINSVVFSPDGKRLACAADKGYGDGGGEIKVWDAETGQDLLTLPAARTFVAFSPDGRRIAGAGKLPMIDVHGPSGSGEIKVWDAETGRELLTLQGHTSDVWSVKFSPDGQRLASGGWHDPTVRVWDAQTGQQLLVLKGQGSCLAFSRDGHWLRGCYRLWNATPLPEK
jgi:WD40 repeat protein